MKDSNLNRYDSLGLRGLTGSRTGDGPVFMILTDNVEDLDGGDVDAKGGYS